MLLRSEVQTIFMWGYDSSKIKLTEDEVVNKSERHSKNSFTYYLSLSKPWFYGLVLQFSELFLDRPSAQVGIFAAFEAFIE